MATLGVAIGSLGPLMRIVSILLADGPMIQIRNDIIMAYSGALHHIFSFLGVILAHGMLAARPAVAQTTQPPVPVVSATVDTWPLFRGDTLGTGMARTSLPRKLDVLWEFDATKVQENAVLSGSTHPSSGVSSFLGGPVIAEQTVYIGDSNGVLYALDFADGKLKWTYQAEAPIESSPGIRDGKIYFGDINGIVYCIEAKSGNESWRFETGGEINSSVNFFESGVLIGSQDARLYFLDCMTGKRIWEFACADQIRATPIIAENNVFVAGCDARLHVVELQTGKAIRAVDLDGPTGVTPAAHGDRLFLATESGTVYAIDWKQGEVLWTFADAARSMPIRAAPAIAQGVVVVGGHHKKVWGISQEDGKLLWEFSLQKKVEASPLIVDDRVFVAAMDGRVYGLGLQSGEEVWQYEFGGEISATPAAAAERLVVALGDGRVVCMGDASKNGVGRESSPGPQR